MDALWIVLSGNKWKGCFDDYLITLGGGGKLHCRLEIPPHSLTIDNISDVLLFGYLVYFLHSCRSFYSLSFMFHINNNLAFKEEGADLQKYQCAHKICPRE